jgi:hypothetical protein
MYVKNEEGITFIYIGLGRCLFRTCVSSSRSHLSSGNFIFTFSFSCGANFTSGALYFFFIIFLWGRLHFRDILIYSRDSSNCLMISFEFLISSSVRIFFPEVNTSHCYQKHQHFVFQSLHIISVSLVLSIVTVIFIYWGKHGYYSPLPLKGTLSSMFYLSL